MPNPISFPEPVVSFLRNGQLQSFGVQLLDYSSEGEISVCAVKRDGTLATGRIGIHPSALPDLIAQLVTMHVSAHPGEADLIRAMVESAIPETPQLDEEELEELTRAPRP